MKYLQLFILFSTLLFSACQKAALQLNISTLALPTTFGLNDIVLRGDTILVAAGDIFVEGGALFQSDDYGQNWQTVQATSQAALSLFSENNQLSATTFGNEFFLKDTAQVWQSQFLVGWEIWRKAAQNQSGRKLLVAGRNFGEGYIQIIDNQGIIGPRLFFPHELSDVCFVAEQVALAVGYGVILRSTDGGDTWQPLDVRGDFYKAVHFPRPEIGYIVGAYGSVLRSSDGGQTWKKLRRSSTVNNQNHRYNAVFFESENVGWLAGDNGILRYTSDGGDSWQRIETDENADWQAIAVDARHIFLVGKDAKMVKIER
jgi:photosystem II stability/assembly factor-like uncharacterized protein